MSWNRRNCHSMPRVTVGPYLPVSSASYCFLFHFSGQQSQLNSKTPPSQKTSQNTVVHTFSDRKNRLRERNRTTVSKELVLRDRTLAIGHILRFTRSGCQRACMSKESVSAVKEMPLQRTHSCLKGDVRVPHHHAAEIPLPGRTGDVHKRYMYEPPGFAQLVLAELLSLCSHVRV